MTDQTPRQSDPTFYGNAGTGAPFDHKVFLGRPVPNHMQVEETSNGGYRLTCRHEIHTPGFPGQVFSPSDRDLSARAGLWFDRHIHDAPRADLSPRQWGKGDPEPVDVKVVRHHAAPELDDFGRDCVWIRRTSDWKGPWGYALSWENLLIEHGPLTEVLPEQGESRTLLGWTVPDHIKFSYAPGLSIGMFISCPKHAFGPLQENYLYPVERDERVGAFLKRHAHDEKVDLPASSPQEAPISSSAGGGDGETVTDELRAELADRLHRALCSGCNPDAGTGLVVRQADVDKAVTAVVSAGWRPPQTDGARARAEREAKQ